MFAKLIIITLLTLTGCSTNKHYGACESDETIKNRCVYIENKYKFLYSNNGFVVKKFDDSYLVTSDMDNRFVIYYDNDKFGFKSAVYFDKSNNVIKYMTDINNPITYQYRDYGMDGSNIHSSRSTDISINIKVLVNGKSCKYAKGNKAYCQFRNSCIIYDENDTGWVFSREDKGKCPYKKNYFVKKPSPSIL